jgi:type IX secretion system PorP/SprF family membrane protein
MISTDGFGQSLPAFNSHFANPFFINPAFAATEYTQVFLQHRQQWLGIEGAPVNSSLTVNSLLDNTRAGLGFKISSYQRGLLNTTESSFAYAYGIPVTPKNKLYFGLSMGAVTTAVDVNKATDPSDPVFSTYQANNLQPIGSAGFLYQMSSGVSLGFVLPQLFSPTYLDASFTALQPAPFDNMIASFGYKKKLEGRALTKKLKGLKSSYKGVDVYAPLEVYLLYRYSAYQTSQFEAMAKFNLSPAFWLGGSYRQAYGVVAHTGFNLKKLSCGYSFELGSQPEAGFSTGSHEFFVSLRFGEKKKFKKEAPQLRSTLTAPQGPQHHARFQRDVENPESILNQEKEVAKKNYYVVIKAFIDFTAADKFKKKMISEKYNAQVYYHPKDKLYHVYIFSSVKSSEAYEEVRNLKNLTKYKTAKVLIVELKQ